jgi:hypothetical protein
VGPTPARLSMAEREEIRVGIVSGEKSTGRGGGLDDLA